MTGITGRTLMASTAMILALSACEDGEFTSPFSSSDDAAAVADGDGEVAAAAVTRTEVREVERADIFSTTENALWDGRPSLGGIWVAHPDVNDPERVRIENTSSGQVVSGALFRRERDNPGPRIQVSSDAAAALGMLAGQPTELSVVVLRQEEVEIEPIIAPAGEVDDIEMADAAMAEEGSLEAAQVDDLAAPMSATADAAPKPKRQGFFASLFGGGASQTEPIQTEVVATDGDVVTTTSASTPSVETATLDPIAAASAAIDEAEDSVAVAPASNGSLQNPFVQVGLFSVEENAEAAASSLREAGIVPTVSAGSNGDRQFWRVLVGPMNTTDEQATMLRQVRDLGYRDAFLAPR